MRMRMRMRSECGLEQGMTDASARLGPRRILKTTEKWSLALKTLIFLFRIMIVPESFNLSSMELEFVSKWQRPCRPWFRAAILSIIMCIKLQREESAVKVAQTPRTPSILFFNNF